jgi:8-oxo-dGTP pyrophosphatase MutT (NUDIX family)
MRSLFQDLYSSIGTNITKEEAGLKIKEVIEKAGEKSDWFIALDNHKNFFMHHGAPYFAADPEHYDQILKETV